MSAVSFRQQAQAFLEQATKLSADPVHERSELRAFLVKVDKLASKIYADKPSKENQEVLMLLMRARNMTILNTAEDPLIRAKKSERLYINTLCPVLPAAIKNSGYDRVQVPTVSTYHCISGEIAAYRFAPSSLPLVPDAVKKAIGSLEGRSVDLLCVTLDTRFIAPHQGSQSDLSYDAEAAKAGHKKRPFNLDIHLWAHQDLIPGMDVGRNFSMGLFPIWGVRSAKGITTHKKPAPIALDELQPLRVHSHPRHKGNKSAGAMLYSPDNAHFIIDLRLPFSATWIAALDGDKRVLITRLLMLHDYSDPYIHCLVKASQNSQNLDQHLATLTGETDRISQTLFEPIITDFADGQVEGALKLFSELPDWHKNNIYKHASFIKKPPKDSPKDFGKLVFLNDEGIDSQFHLSNQEKIQAIAHHIEELRQVLHGEMIQLLNASHEYRSQLPEKTALLTRLAEKFEDHDPSALEEFRTLSEDLQKLVFQAIWRINGRPQGDPKFGRKRFEACDHQERAKALYLAASSLPLTAPNPPSKIKLEELRVAELGEKKKSEKKEEGKKKPSSPKEKEPASEPAKPVKKDVSSPKGSPALDQAIDLNEKLGKLVEALDVIKFVKPQERPQQLHTLFDSLNIDKQTVKYEIYKDLGKEAGKSDQAALEYGRANFGKNLESLKKVLLKRIADLQLQISASLAID